MRSKKRIDSCGNIYDTKQGAHEIDLLIRFMFKRNHRWNKEYHTKKCVLNICYFFRIYCDIICLLAEFVACCKIDAFPKIIINKKL